MRGLLFFSLIWWGIGSAVWSHAADHVVRFEHSTLSIQSENGNHDFKIEIARTPEQRSQGLMYRKSMPKNHGMLFLFDESQTVVMWMKNTYIPLDILFINQTGQIVYIAKFTVPESLDHITTLQPVISVLELNAGMADHLGIGVGDRVDHRFFKPKALIPQ